MTFKPQSYRGASDRSIRRSINFNVQAASDSGEHSLDHKLIEIVVIDDFDSTMTNRITDVLVFADTADSIIPQNIDTASDGKAAVAGVLRKHMYESYLPVGHGKDPTGGEPSRHSLTSSILNWGIARGRPVMPYSPGMYCCVTGLGYDAVLLGQSIVITGVNGDDIPPWQIDDKELDVAIEAVEEELTMLCSGRRSNGIGAVVWRSIRELQLYKEKSLLWGLEPFHVMIPTSDSSVRDMTGSGLLCVRGPIPGDRSSLQNDFSSIEQLLTHVMANHPNPVMFNGEKRLWVGSVHKREFVAPRVDIQLVKGDVNSTIVVSGNGVSLSTHDSEPFIVTDSITVPLSTTDSDIMEMWKSGELLTDWCKLVIMETGRISIDCFIQTRSKAE